MRVCMQTCVDITRVHVCAYSPTEPVSLALTTNQPAASAGGPLTISSPSARGQNEVSAYILACVAHLSSYGFHILPAFIFDLFKISYYLFTYLLLF